MSSPLPSARQSAGSVASVFAALLIAIFAFQLNASMLSPALVVMERQLDATSSQIGLTQTAFFTAAALFSLFLPRWADLIGRRKVLTGMMIVLVLGSIVCALAPNVTVLFIGRVIQGVAGPTIPLCLIMLRKQVTSDKQFALLMSILTSINGGIAGVDALAGGWLADNHGFRSLFWVIAVVAALALVAVWFSTQESVADETPPMDWMGVVPLVIAIASILIAFNEAGKLAAANWILVAVLIVVAAICLGWFWRIESTSPHPLVPTTYLKQRRTWALLTTTVLTMTGVFAVMNGLVPNLGQAIGIDAEHISWWTLTPYALAGLAFGPICGILAGRVGYRIMLQVGLLGTVIGLAAMTFLAGSASSGILLAVSIFIGVTYGGISNIMLGGLGVVLSPSDNPGYLPGMNAGAFNLGAGLSFAILFAVFTAFGDSGYQAGIATGAVFLLLALATSFFIPKPETLDDVVSEQTLKA